MSTRDLTHPQPLPRPARAMFQALLRTLRRLNGPLGFAAAHLLALVTFYWPVLTRQADFFHRDIPLYFEPLARFIGDAAVHGGRLPLWNSGLYTGMPQVAVGHPNLFYPFTWLLALLPFSQGLGFYFLIHQFVLGLAFFFLVRRFQWGAGAAWIAGLSSAWNGYILGMQSNFQLVSAAAWIPVLVAGLAAVEDDSGRIRRGPALLSALAVFLLIGTGAPELIGPGLGIAFSWTIYLAFQSGAGRALQGGRRSWLAKLLWRLAAMAVGLGMAAPMILPTTEWLRLSVRAEGISVRNALLWSTEWYQWLGMLVSYPFGRDAVQSVPRYLDSPFLGACILGLGLWGFHGLPWRKALPPLLAIGLLALVAAGQTTPLGAWLVGHIPGFSSVRYPVKLSILPVLGLVLAAARGMGRIGEAVPARRALQYWFALTAVLATAAIWASRDLTRNWYWTTSGAEIFAIQTIFLEEANHNLAINLFGAALAVLLLSVVTWLFSRNKLQRGTYVLLLTTVSILPLLASAFRFGQNWLNAEVFPQEPSWRAISAAVAPDTPARNWRILPVAYNDRVSRVSLGWLRDNSSHVPELTDVSLLWLTHVRSERSLLLENTALDSPFLSSWGYEAAFLRTYNGLRRNALAYSTARPDNYKPVAPLRSDRPLARFCSLTAARYMLQKPDPDAPDLRRFEAGPLFQTVLDLQQFSKTALQAPRLYEAVGARPRVYISRSVESIADTQGLLGVLGSPEETGFDRIPGHSYVLASDATTLRQFVGATQTQAGAAEGADAVELLHDGGESIRLRARLGKPGLIVLADQFYPGWEATVDGREQPILQVNLINRGVLADAGEHVVEMHYRPRSVRAGLAIAAVSLLGFLLLCWLYGRKPQPGPHEPNFTHRSDLEDLASPHEPAPESLPSASGNAASDPIIKC